MHWAHSVMGPIRCLGPLLNGPNTLLKGPSLNGPSINQGPIAIQIICKIVHLITKYSDGTFNNVLGPFSNGPNTMCQQQMNGHNTLLITKGPITEWAQYQSRAHCNTNYLQDCSLDYQINIVMGPLVMHWAQFDVWAHCLLNGPNTLLKGPSPNGPSINQGPITIQIICKIFT